MRRWLLCILAKPFRNVDSLHPGGTEWSATLERFIFPNVVGSKVTRNRKYQDPGSGLLPLQPVTEARSRYRTMLAERRRQEASSRATSTLERRETNARYQEVIADGQNCYVVTSRLCGPASKKTVTKV